MRISGRQNCNLRQALFKTLPRVRSFVVYSDIFAHMSKDFSPAASNGDVSRAATIMEFAATVAAKKPSEIEIELPDRPRLRHLFSF